MPWLLIGSWSLTKNHFNYLHQLGTRKYTNGTKKIYKMQIKLIYLLKQIQQDMGFGKL